MLTDAIRSRKFTTDPEDGSCRSEDGAYPLILAPDGRVQVVDAGGRPTGASWELPLKPVFLDGLHTDPLSGNCLWGRGAYGFARGPAGLVHIFDAAGNRSDAPSPSGPGTRSGSDAKSRAENCGHAPETSANTGLPEPIRYANVTTPVAKNLFRTKLAEAPIYSAAGVPTVGRASAGRKRSAAPRIGELFAERLI